MWPTDRVLCSTGPSCGRSRRAGWDLLRVRGACRLQAAVKLALLRSEAGDLQLARSVLYDALACAETARSLANVANAGREDECWLHVSASRSQAHAGLERHLAALPPNAEHLAQLHADALLLLWRVELLLGCQEQNARACQARAQQVAKLARRKEQVRLYGTLTRTQQRRQEERIASAGRTESHCALKEHALLSVVNQNP